VNSRRPWEIGNHRARWDGELVEPDSAVLRYKVGATTVEESRAHRTTHLSIALPNYGSAPWARGTDVRPRSSEGPSSASLPARYEWASEVRSGHEPSDPSG
jgi:hypothetical protein